MNNINVTLVSGGSKGLGLCIVKKLLESGHCVAALARNKNNEISEINDAYPNTFMFISGDISKPESFSEIINLIESRFGRLTGLVNNAGVISESLLVQQSVHEIEKLLSVNLLGPLLLTRQAIRGMMIAKRGCIVNISSIVSISGYKGTSAYSASKGGINSLTRALARELGRRGINVNTVAPGYMETSLVADMSPTHLKQIVRRTPLGRAGTVDDVAGVVKFLLSEDAKFISGQTIVVDGGLTA
jgi:3-oxoacyl-[acyl-carrier protein] reductase